MSDSSDFLHKAVDILDCFDLQSPLLGITDLSRRLNLPKSTTQRIINNLRYHGLVEQDPSTGKYRLGVHLFELGLRALRHMELPRRAEPHLITLTARTGETSTLAILDKFEALYVGRTESKRMLRASSIGSRMPLHSTAIGKVLLASLDEAELERFFMEKELSPRTKMTVTDPERLREHIRQIRRQGYAFDVDEFEEGLICIAAPIHNHASQIIAALGIAFPAARADEARQRELLDAVCDAVTDISQEMGYNGSWRDAI
jgi:IclR family transcriptional regulator, KDG regulon repressor